MKRKERVVIYLTPEQAYNLGPYIQARLARGERVPCSGEVYAYPPDFVTLEAPAVTLPRRRATQLELFA